MGKGTKSRKRPGRHTVHTRDPRYNVKNYPRGEGDLVESNTLIHGRLKSRCKNCGNIFYGSTIEHYQVCPKCKKKSGVPYHGSSPVSESSPERSQVWIDKWEKEREEYIKRGKPLSKLEERIARHKASLILGRDFGEDPDSYKRRRGLTEYYDWKLDTSGKSKKKVSKRKNPYSHWRTPKLEAELAAYKKSLASNESDLQNKSLSKNQRGVLTLGVKRYKRNIGLIEAVLDNRKTKKAKNTTKAYLSEKVDYGGERVSRGEMIKDLQEQAKKVHPDDKKAQARLVSSYLAGHGRSSQKSDKSKKKVSKRDAVITHTSQKYSGPYGEALHDVWITVDGKYYFVPSVPGNTIDYNKNKNTLRDLIKLSGTEPRERSIGSMSIRGSKS